MLIPLRTNQYITMMIMTITTTAIIPPITPPAIAPVLLPPLSPKHVTKIHYSSYNTVTCLHTYVASYMQL